MFKFLIPLLLVGIVLSQDNMVNLQTVEGRLPYVDVEAFTFSDDSYTIMFQVNFESLSGSDYKTIVWARSPNVPAAQDPNLIAIQAKTANQWRVNFGPWDPVTVPLSGSLSINTIYSFTVMVQPTGTNGQINLAIYVNTERDPRFSGIIRGVIAQGTRVAYLGARYNDNGARSEFLNGLLDNFVILNGAIDETNRVSLHSPHNNWNPSTTILNKIALWIHFNDAVLALQNTAVAVTKVVNGQSTWVHAKVVGGGFFLGHSVGGELWKTCSVTGDPHYYDWYGQHVGGGEQLLGHYLFQTCDNENLEIRTHTRMVQWWGNTVFRVAAIKYKDYIWRVNLNEQGNANTRAGWPNVATQVAPLRFYKHVTETTWHAIGDKTEFHPQTGARYHGYGGNSVQISIPDVATFTINACGNYMNLYLTMNLGRCTSRRGACDRQLYNPVSDVFFNDLKSPPPLPETPPVVTEPCAGVDEQIKNRMITACKRYYPNQNSAAYLDCLFDACSSGDPDMIPDQDLTPACQLERLTGVDNPDCDVVACQGNCFGRGDCENGVCVNCDAGYGGFDCYQQESFTCHTVSYDSVSVNVEPRTIFKNRADNLRMSFVDFSVLQSLLIYPATYDGKEYLQFVVSSAESELAGSFRVCVNGASNAVAGPFILTKPADDVQVGGTVSVAVTGTLNNFCADVNFAAYSVGGFYIEIDGSSAASYNIAVSNTNGLKQVLIGSQNGRGGIDVSKVPAIHIGGFTWDMGLCQNDACYVHDESCMDCWAQDGCGFCQETQRCMSGTAAGPRRGTCENWRYEYGISRVVTTRFDGDDLVNPDYEVFLSGGDEGVPVSIFVPTARTNNNIDIQFMFGTRGSFAANSASLKNNLLSALFAFQTEMNLGLGYYGDANSVSTIDLTRVDTRNHYLFARALEVPVNTIGAQTGGVFNSLRKVISGTGYRQHSRRLAVFTVYEIDNSNTLAATRDEVLKSRVFPVWVIPRGVSQNVVDFYTSLNDRVDGIPSVVIRIDPSGSDFQSAFRQIFLLSASFPHVIVDLSDDEYNHIDQDLLTDTADSLSIAGLTNILIRARFLIPMKHSGDVDHHVATIRIPGFGSSIIEDVAEIHPVVTGDRSFAGEENSKCIQVTLAAKTFNELAAPVFKVTTNEPRLFLYDPTQPNNVGAPVVQNQWYAQKTYCFVPDPHDHSIPPSAVYDSFTYVATDGCSESNAANVDIYVTPLYLPPTTTIDQLVLTEGASGGEIPFTIFEADMLDDGSAESVYLTFSSFSVDYMSNLHGAAPQGFYGLEGVVPEIVSGTKYGPYAVDANHENAQTVVYNAPANENFFGTFYAYLQLSDNGNPGRAPASQYYPVVTKVTPVNDAPTAHLVGDDIFDPTGVNQWVREDEETSVYLTGKDVDNFGIGIDLRISYNDPDPNVANFLPSINGQRLTTSWLRDACKATSDSGIVNCKIDFQAGPNYNSCGQANQPVDLDLHSIMCPDGPAVTIEYIINDHNSVGFNWPSSPTSDLTVTGQIHLHVIAVNDPPVPPQPKIVELVEDQSLEEVVITVTDIDTTEVELDLFIYNICPDLITLTQNDGTAIDDTVNPIEILDKVKRDFSQDHSFNVETIENLHGTDRNTNWEICRLGSFSYDGQLASLTDSYVSIRVRPVNDAPYDLLTYFEKNEDVNEVYNIMDLTATDVDNAADELTYVITQLPWYDLQKGEGVVIHVIDPATGNVDEDVYLTDDDLPYTVQLNDDGEALVWVRNLANWYGELVSDDDALIYTVTDQDNFLNDGEVGYIVNTVPSKVEIIIPPVNDRPITTVQPPAGDEDVVQLVHLLGINDKYGEQDDILSVTLIALEKVFSNDYSENPQLLFQYDEDWYNAYVLDASSVSVDDLVPLNVGDNVTDPTYRILFVPPQNMNKAASNTESPLFIAPQLQYQMVEIVSHADPIQLRSTISDWVSITVNPVNDVPVTWGGEWNVESNPSYDEFYGGNEWTYPEGYGDDATTFDNTICIDDCYYTEDFGIVGHYLSLSPREIKFGGRDVEGDDLEVVIRSVDCQSTLQAPRNARWEFINSTGRFEVATEDLPGMTLGRLVQRIPGEGYKLVSMLTFAPARNDWNVPSAETHENDVSGEESPYYCQLTYAVVDSEGLASDDAELGAAPKTITIQVRQQNDQPTDSVLQDPSQSSTLVGYEDRNLFIRFDASDVEDDDFVFNVVSCDNSRGKFFYPSNAQSNFIDENGVLDANADLNAMFQLRNEIPCDSAVIPAQNFEYSDTNGKGWFILFQPNTNDYGQDFSFITVSYDDNTVAGQDPQLSDRFIDIRAVNDAPRILSGGEPASNLVNQIVVGNGQNFALALSFEDVDALTSNGEEFSQLGFQLRVSSAVLNNQELEVREAFSYEVAPGEGFIFNSVEIQPTNEYLGLVRWIGSISQANSFASRVAVKFEYLGDYIIEIVAADNGRSGYCTPDVVFDDTVYPEEDIRTIIGTEGKPLGPPGYEDSRCNRVSVVELNIKVTSAAAVIGGIASASGAALLALLALGAVVFAKLKKPEDLDAWQALDNAQMTNVQVSGIHSSGKVGGTSQLYVSKQ